MHREAEELMGSIREILRDVLDSDDEDSVPDTASCLYDLAEKVRRLDDVLIESELFEPREVGQ